MNTARKLSKSIKRPAPLRSALSLKGLRKKVSPTPTPIAGNGALFGDPFLLGLSLLLALFGMLMIYSTTGVASSERFGDSWFFVKRQGIALFIGLGLVAVTTRLSRQLLERLSPFALPLGLFLLVLPLIPGLGRDAGGATRWISMAGFQFQPGEFVKVLFVLFLSGYFLRQEKRIGTFLHGAFIPFLFVAALAVFFLLQPDFGSSALIALTAFVLCLANGAKLRYLGGIGVALLMSAGLLVMSSPYRMSRVMTFLNPTEDTSGKGYQLFQSLIAVGSGELSGVGLGESQQKLFFLPAAHTDFIFAVVAEELGFIGAVCLLFLFIAFLARGLRLAREFSDDVFGFSLAMGMTLLIVLPAALNMGVVLGLLPTKGLVLPLVGYGGSSLMASFLAVGVLLALSRSASQRLQEGMHARR